MQIFSSTVRNLWTTWELPVLVLSSLLLQVALIPMGYKRKYTSNHWLRWLLWLAYLSADWVATVSLGILSNYDDGSACDNGGGPSPEPRYVIRALWAPFLLLHLGGPDTITAYSMQDNDLWLRHFLGLFVQAGLAFYVFLRALKPTPLNFIAIPIFVCGIIKYGERTWVLRSASAEHLRSQVVPVSIAGRSIFPSFSQQIKNSPYVGRDLEMLHVAHGFFQRNKWVFADLVLNIQDLKETLCCFQDFDSKDAFKLVELELGFMHDFFYTKSSIIHSQWGAFLRLATFSSTLVAIVTFCTTAQHTYPPLDVYLIFLLLFGALSLEFYSIFLFMRSDWCVIWLSKIDHFLARFTFKLICSFGLWSIGKTRWSNSVPQHNLITHCLEDMTSEGEYFNFLKASHITKIMDTQPISEKLKKRIFSQLKQKVENEDQGINDNNSNNKVSADWIVKKQNLYKDKLGWSEELDTDQSILLWHIATNLCYYSVHEDESLSSSIKDTKSLSEYLTYLLVTRHSLFPNGTSQMRFNATVKETIKFLDRSSRTTFTVRDACKNILQDLELKTDPTDVKENGSSSVLHYGCWLARELEKMEEEEKWEIIGNMWVEMVADVCCECRMYDHVEQLGHGGDFLTHVWLLMHHFGFDKQAYNVTTALQRSEILAFYKVVQGYNAIESLPDRNNYLIHFLEGLQ